jgi:hypothetical protein
MTTVAFLSIKSPTFNEAEIRFNDRPLTELTRFRETRFSKLFAYTRERTDANILLTAAASLGLPLSAIAATGNNAYRISLASGASKTIDVRHAMTTDVAQEQYIFDMGAGLSELVEADDSLKARLDGYQVTFIVPGFESEEAAGAIWLELQEFLRREDLSRFDPLELEMIERTYPALNTHSAKINVRKGNPRFVQMMQGAKAIGGPEVGLMTLHGALNEALAEAKRTEHSEWLLIWFQSILAPFDVKAAEGVMKAMPTDPYEKVLVSDGRTLAVLERAPAA